MNDVCRSATALLVLMSTALASLMAAAGASAQEKRLIAHRGASAHAPENTLHAFDAALALGADVIELDVQFSGDRIPVVIHDDTLQRTTNVAEVFPRRARISGRGQPVWRVQDFTLRDLRRLDAGSWFAEAFEGARIPSLVEALRHINGRAAVIVDVKPQLRLPLGPVTAARRIAEAIAAGGGRGARDWVAVSSFDRRGLNAAVLAQLARFIAVDTPPGSYRSDNDLFPPGVCGVSVSRRLLAADADLPRRARARGRQVIVWAFDSPVHPAPAELTTELLHYVQAVDVDGVMTNRLEEFRAMRPRDASRVSWSPCFNAGPARAVPRSTTPPPAPASGARRRAAPRN